MEHPELMREFRERLHELWLNDSHLVLSRRLGIARQTWEQYETGERDMGSIRIMQVCIATKVDPDWLLFGNEKVAWRQNSKRPVRQRSDGVIEIHSKRVKPKGKGSKSDLQVS